MSSFHAIAAAFLIAACTVPASASPGKPTLDIRAGEPFIAARSRIMKAGWKPARIDRGNYGISGTETTLANLGIHEFESCSMSAGSLCVLYYRKRNACLRVDTIGEEVRDMKVTSWTKECPKPFG